MKTNYIVLIPISESKKEGGNENKPFRITKNKKEYNYFMNELWIEREKILGKLRETISLKDLKELEKIFKTKTDKLRTIISLNEDILNSPTMPAIERFNGTMYKEIEINELNQYEIENLKESIIIIDALFGIIKANDLIPNYNLKINTKLNDINLFEFWQTNLEPIFHKLSDKTIINMLPENQSNILKNNNQIKIKFMKIKTESKIKNKDKNNVFENIGHESKKLRGKLIRQIIKEKNLDYKKIVELGKKINLKFNEKLSTKNEIIFIKN